MRFNPLILYWFCPFPLAPSPINNPFSNSIRDGEKNRKRTILWICDYCEPSSFGGLWFLGHPCGNNLLRCFELCFIYSSSFIYINHCSDLCFNSFLARMDTHHRFDFVLFHSSVDIYIHVILESNNWCLYDLCSGYTCIDILIMIMVLSHSSSGYLRLYIWIYDFISIILCVRFWFNCEFTLMNAHFISYRPRIGFLY